MLSFWLLCVGCVEKVKKVVELRRSFTECKTSAFFKNLITTLFYIIVVGYSFMLFLEFDHSLKIKLLKLCI